MTKHFTQRYFLIVPFTNSAHKIFTSVRKLQTPEQHCIPFHLLRTIFSLLPRYNETALIGFLCIFPGYVFRGSSTCLSSWWPLLLPVPSRIFWLRVRRPCPCHCVHSVHAGLMCILFQNMDRGLRLLCQRCKYKLQIN